MEQEMPPPQQPADPIEREDMAKLVYRQHVVITKLKEQIGNVVLANVEASAVIDELRQEVNELRNPAQHTDG
jgi:hypothetical protein